ncbi:MAG: hypothetical protein ACI8PB_004891 [Desulforhopalus sp.]|jgi:hypothetical protein
MSNTAIAKELSDLRAQIEELQMARKHEQEDQEAQPHEQPEASNVPETDADSIQRVLTDKFGLGDVEDQVQEFITALEEEINDTNPMTMLVVFALGVLVGRLLPK